MIIIITVYIYIYKRLCQTLIFSCNAFEMPVLCQVNQNQPIYTLKFIKSYLLFWFIYKKWAIIDVHIEWCPLAIFIILDEGSQPCWLIYTFNCALWHVPPQQQRVLIKQKEIRHKVKKDNLSFQASHSITDHSAFCMFYLLRWRFYYHCYLTNDKDLDRFFQWNEFLM